MKNKCLADMGVRGLKTPITFYGGKQNIADWIISHFPEHEIYVEAFFGGGAVFWRKNPSELEVINDTNYFVFNFFNQLRKNYNELRHYVMNCVLDENTNEYAKEIYKGKRHASDLEKAWVFWYLSKVSYASVIGQGFGYDINSRQRVSKLVSGKNNFHECLSKRLQGVQVFNKDAIELLKMYDNEKSLFYLDPPYIDRRQGNYEGYKKEHLRDLLEFLRVTRAKFILSHYHNDLLGSYIEKEGWYVEERQVRKTAGKFRNQETEILVMNYCSGNHQLVLC